MSFSGKASATKPLVSTASHQIESVEAKFHSDMEIDFSSEFHKLFFRILFLLKRKIVPRTSGSHIIDPTHLTSSELVLARYDDPDFGSFTTSTEVEIQIGCTGCDDQTVNRVHRGLMLDGITIVYLKDRLLHLGDECPLT
ncbi:hypothetical protein L6452_15455 [Arctium lappa]|uniref:Uncharacterized protein n=1 Tax=Arctium lappa TaxID=4217 RepID=A0ACB9CNX3_ARCLA|nr:hypothetical protein L6452_15455 [Arctium lappa]